MHLTSRVRRQQNLPLGHKGKKNRLCYILCQIRFPLFFFSLSLLLVSLPSGFVLQRYLSLVVRQQSFDSQGILNCRGQRAFHFGVYVNQCTALTHNELILTASTERKDRKNIQGIFVCGNCCMCVKRWHRMEVGGLNKTVSQQCSFCAVQLLWLTADSSYDSVHPIFSCSFCSWKSVALNYLC